MPKAELRAADRWLGEFVERHRAEVERRDLAIHLDVDDGFVLARDARLDRAFQE